MLNAHNSMPIVGVNCAKIHRNSPQLSIKGTLTEGQGAGGKKRMLQINKNTRAGVSGKVNRVETFLCPV